MIPYISWNLRQRGENMKEKHYNDLNETVYNIKHETGLDVFIIPKRDHDRCYGMLSVLYGSIDREFLNGGDKSVITPEGMAHFLEHKMFEQKDGSIFEKYAKLGASPNAYTTFTTTSYLFSTTKDIVECIRLLLSSVFNPFFTEEGIEKEKDVIKQEIMMYQDNPDWRLYYNLLDCMYRVHPVKNEVAGTLKSIEYIDKKMLYQCYNAFYHPSNCVLLLVGDVDNESILSLIDDELGKKQYSADKTVRIYPHEPCKLNRSYMEQKLNVSAPVFAVGIKDLDVGYRGHGLLKKEIEISILLEMMFGRSSPAFKEMYEKGLINNSFGTQYVGEKDFGYTIISGESKDPYRAYDSIKNYIKCGMDVIAEERLKNIKRKFAGQFISRFNTVDGIGSSFMSYHMRGINLFNYIKTLNDISLDDVISRFKEHLNIDNMALSVVNP